MRRMYSQQELIKLIQEYGMTPAQVIEMLVGKYVRIMDAPTSTTLTDEQIAQIQEGVFINGTFLQFTNPVLFPFRKYGDNREYGFIVGQDPNGFGKISQYRISANKEISVTNEYIGFGTDRTLLLNGFNYPVAGSQNNVNSGDVITNASPLDKALKAHLEVQINGHRCRFESEEESGESTYIIYSSFGEVSATGKLTANIISYNKSTREISFNQMTFTPDA